MKFDDRSHVGSEALEQYSLQHLSEAECERVEEHLLICPQCQDELAQIETFIADMKAAIAIQQQRELARSGESLFARWFRVVPRPALVTAFAAVVLAVAAVPWMMRENAPAAAPFAVQLAVMRGPESAGMATAESGRPVQLRISAAEIPEAPAYRLQVVNAAGEQVWTGEPRREDAQLAADVAAPLPKGAYWVRLYASGGEHLREFGLMVK